MRTLSGILELNLNDVVELERNISGISILFCVIRAPYTNVTKKVIRDLRSTPKDFIVLLPKTLIPDEKVMKLAAFLTYKSFENGTNISKHVPIQFLLNLFATRQIRDVTKLIDKYWKDGVVAVEIRLLDLGEEASSLIRDLRQNGVICDEVKGIEGDLSVLANKVYGIHDGIKAVQYMKSRNNYLVKSILTKIAYFGAVSSR